MAGDLKRVHDGLVGFLAGTDRKVAITADCVVQVPVVSLRCASLGLREQERLFDSSGDPADARALAGCERMPVPRRFYGFKGPGGYHEEVDVVGGLGVGLEGERPDTQQPTTMEGVVSQCRVCPAQE